MSDETPPVRREIVKLPRSVCTRCGLEGPKPMVRDGRCVNLAACDRRFDQQTRRKAKGQS